MTSCAATGRDGQRAFVGRGRALGVLAFEDAAQAEGRRHDALGIARRDRRVERLRQQVDQVALGAAPFVVLGQQPERLRVAGLLEQHVLQDRRGAAVAGVLGQPQAGERHAQLIPGRDLGQQRQRLLDQAAEAVAVAQADVVVDERLPQRFVGGRGGAQALEQLRAQAPVAGAAGALREIARERHHAIERQQLRRALQDVRGGVEIAGRLLDPEQLEQRPGGVLAPVAALGGDVRQPDQQRLHPLLAVERHGQVDRLAHLARRDVGRGDPPLEIVEQHGVVAGRAGDALVERQDLHQLRVGHARGGDQRRRAFEIAALLDRLGQIGDAGLARLCAPELQRGRPVQRLRGGLRAARLAGGELERTGHPVALGDVALLLREPGDAGQHVERPRLHLLGAVMQIERARLIAEVALGDVGRQQQQRGRDAHVGLAAAPLDQRQQPLAERLQLPGRARELDERRVQAGDLRGGLDRPQLRLEGGLRLALGAQALGQLRARSPPPPGCRPRARAASRTGARARRGRPLQETALQPRRLVRVLDRGGEGGVEQLVRLGGMSALARQAVEPQQDLRQGEDGGRRGGRGVFRDSCGASWAASSRVCTSRVR